MIRTLIVTGTINGWPAGLVKSAEWLKRKKYPALMPAAAGVKDRPHPVA